MKSVRIVTDGLPEHPATVAWRELRGGPVPERILVLKHENKTHVFRLEGVGDGGAPVIAKRCYREIFDVERPVYEEILPRLRVPQIRYYGSREDADLRYGWMFVEDLGAENFSADDPRHRELAGRWIGEIHATGGAIEAARTLPDRGPGHFLEHLRVARRNILGSVDNPALAESTREALRGTARRLDVVEADWPRVEAACGDIPRTLVHGDLARRNMRVRGGNGTAGLVTFDWETAGWGVPGVDLRCANLDAYRDTVRDRWPDTDAETARRWVAVGHLLRGTIAAMSWRSWFLAYEWADREAQCIVRYGTEMESTFETLDGRAG